jgi:hypothetical protein
MGSVKVELNLDKLNNGTKLNQSLTVLNNIENSIRFAKESGYKELYVFLTTLYLVQKT